MAEAQHHDLQLSYELLDLDRIPGGVEALEDVLLDAQASGFVGVNVTHPCKQRVIQHLHGLSEHARALGAVNTVVFTEGKRIGHNTDWVGFAEGFRLGLPGAPMETVTQLGAGGAGSAVAYAMLHMGARLLNVLDTDPNKALQLASKLAAQFGRGRIQPITSMAEALDRSDGLINTTPVGMKSHPGLPLPAVLLRTSLWVAEVVYFPLETELLKAARALGCRTIDGGGMVVFQAAESFRLFTGIKPDASRMLQWFRTHIRV
jgi:shikimate dehydrogenase